MVIPCLVILSLAAPGGDAISEEFVHDFRKGLPPKAVLPTFGTGAAQLLKPDPQGLRITLPANRPSPEGVGLSLRLWIGGDFEVTTAYEILSGDRPEPDAGIGFKIWAQFDAESSPAATVAYCVHTKQGSAFFARYAWLEGEGEKKIKQKIVPTTSKKGQLRLQRAGSALRFLAAEDGANDFQELLQVEAGTEPIRALRLVADTAGPKGKLDLRLTDFKIRSASLGTSSTVKQGGWPWPVLLGIGVTVGGVALAGAFVYWRNRSQGTQSRK